MFQDLADGPQPLAGAKKSVAELKKEDDAAGHAVKARFARLTDVDARCLALNTAGQVSTKSSL